MSPKWRKRVIILVIFISAILALRFTIFRPKPIDISAYKVQRGKVEETVSNSKAGTVKVRQRAKLSPEIGGRVTYLGAREGEKVKAGQLLLKLEDSDLKASLSLAERALQSARSSMKEACVAADWAARELERNRALNQQGIVAEAILDQARNRYDAAKARCEATKAEAKRAESAIEMARANLRKAELRAPFDGVIAQLSTEVGEWITPNPPGVPIPPVIDILDNSRVYVQAPIDETDAGRLQIGLPVRISLDPYPNKTFPGKLSRIAPFVQDIEGQNRTVDVEAEFNELNFARTLLPGTSADLEVILSSHENVLRIPTYALMEGNKVLIVDQGKLISRNVKSGLRNWEFTEIEDGLKAGDLVALSLDIAQVKEGAQVRVAQERNK
jgi:HlyD family secretion protein